MAEEKNICRAINFFTGFNYPDSICQKDLLNMIKIP